MDALRINRLIRGLGSTYEELLAEDVIPNLPLEPSFVDDEHEDLIQTPEPGVELWFWAATRRLERVLFTLVVVAEGDSIYTGELPTPYTHEMDQASVRDMLGEPFESKAPLKIMLSTGLWGRDAYRLGATVHPNARVGFQYRKDNRVCTLGFTLINKGHD